MTLIHLDQGMLGKKCFLRFLNGLLLLGSILTAFLACEFGARFYFHFFEPEAAARISSIQKSIENYASLKPKFKPHPYLSYTPSYIELMDDGCVIHGEKFLFTPPANTFRIACLGGSTTMLSYPLHLAKALQPCMPDIKIEVMDWGCSGWTIVESLINYNIRGRLFHPDLVILHHGINDIAPRSRDAVLFDYSHYRKSAGNFRIPKLYQYINPSDLLVWLLMRMEYRPADLDALTVQPVSLNGYCQDGMIPETSSRTYREAVSSMKALCRDDGTQLLLAGMVYNVTRSLTADHARIIDQHNQIFQDCSKSSGISYVDTQRFFRFHERYFLDQAHLKTWGDMIKANMYANAIARIEGVPPRIWITDTVNSSENLAGGIDEDLPGERELVLHWNSVPEGTRDVHVYVGINWKKEKYLGNVQDVKRTFLSWRPQSGRIQNDFRTGPQFGNHYSFSAWFVIPGAANLPLVMHDTVFFAKQKEKE